MIEALILTQVSQFNFIYVDLMSIMINVMDANIMEVHL